jgi:hypothetical protein
MMDIQTVQEDLDNIKKEYDAKVEEIREVGLTKLFKSFFEENPEIQAISFVGYIPGFNDGDSCVFGLGEVNFAGPEADLEEVPEYEAEGDEGWFANPSPTKYVKNPDFQDRSFKDRRENPNPKIDEYYLKDENGKGIKVPNPLYKESLGVISSFIHKNDELMNRLFGDNFKVVITPQEIRVEEYDCGY